MLTKEIAIMIREIWCPELKQEAWAEYLDVGYKRWNHLETGRTFEFPKDIKIKLLSKCPGIDFNFLESGSPKTLTGPFAEKYREYIDSRDGTSN